ncbi:MAG: polyprenol monophosphomannose synthase [Acidimicrobiales bacterium]
MRTLVVLPTYNEAENIGRVLESIRASSPDSEVLVVDDGSPDGTADIAERVGKELGGVDVLRRTEKSGLGSAYRAGFTWGLDRGMDVLVEMDADFSHDPAQLPDLVAPMSRGYDLAVGSRYVPGGSIPNWSWHRRLLSHLGNVYASVALGLHVHDSTSGFRAYRADVLRKLDLEAVRADGYGFQIEMVYRVLAAGGRVCEVPIRFVDRVEGSSKMSGIIVVEALALVTIWAVKRALRTIAGLVTGSGSRAPHTSIPERSDSIRH